MTTTNSNLSGNLHAVSMQELPTSKVSYSELPSYVPLDYAKVVNSPLFDGAVVCSEAFYNKFVQAPSDISQLAKSVVSSASTFNDVVLANVTVEFNPIGSDVIPTPQIVPILPSGRQTVMTPYLAGPCYVSASFEAVAQPTPYTSSFEVIFQSRVGQCDNEYNYDEYLLETHAGTFSIIAGHTGSFNLGSAINLDPTQCILDTQLIIRPVGNTAPAASAVKTSLAFSGFVSTLTLIDPIMQSSAGDRSVFHVQGSTGVKTININSCYQF